MSQAKREMEDHEEAERLARIHAMRAAIAGVPREQLIAVIQGECCDCESSVEVDELLDDWREIAPAAVAAVEAERWGDLR